MLRPRLRPFHEQSVKFDDLCTNFQHHEELDDADALVTVTKTSSGSISGMELSATNSAGVIPVTVPSSMVTSDEASLYCVIDTLILYFTGACQNARTHTFAELFGIACGCGYI